MDYAYLTENESVENHSVLHHVSMFCVFIRQVEERDPTEVEDEEDCNLVQSLCKRKVPHACYLVRK